ncbi:hypothetical protein PF008_g10002 [Phytophthora fragariae]|uniref:Reverse transcriptase domain-containing protein n=1 Tax=Phytophthora fragariae TaxID=53985 RepID=A0A6G0RUW5_9STRA|nr:hypothetical protein PF008_g10002 [Phytophthora fragariae]
MLATRTSQKLSRIVHPNQNGFVSFRNIHSTIDLFTAAQVAVSADPAMAKALALLLDVCKAYDSVDREFLYDGSGVQTRTLRLYGHFMKARR